MTNIEVSKERDRSKEAKVGDILISPDNKLSMLMMDNKGYYCLLCINTVGEKGVHEAGTLCSARFTSLPDIRVVIAIKRLKVVKDIEILVKE